MKMPSIVLLVLMSLWPVNPADAQYLQHARIAASVSCTSGACSDAFTGSTGSPLASAWIDLSPTSTIVASEFWINPTSGTITCCSSGNEGHEAGAMYSLSTADYSKTTVGPQTTGPTLQGVVLRGTSGGDFYSTNFAGFSGGFWTQLVVSRGPTHTFVGQFTGSWANTTSHLVAFSCSGTSTVTFAALVDGSAASGTVTDSSSPLPPGGHPGIILLPGGTSGYTFVGPWQDHP